MIEIQLNSQAVTDGLNRLEQRTSNLTPALNSIGEHITSEVDSNFKDSHDPYGNPWDPLADTTEKRRRHGRQRNASNQPLRDTGVLQNSISYTVNYNAVQIGTNVEYAPTHQFGADQGQYASGVPWGDIPARPFLPTAEGGLPDDWQNEVLTILTQHLQNAL